jgi:hypothetical protein
MTHLRALGRNERRVNENVALRNHVKHFLLPDCREACSYA